MKIEGNGQSVITMMQSESALAVELGGDTNAQVAAMVLRHGHDSRAAARQTRRAEEQRLRAHESRQIDELRKQAVKVLHAAQAKALGKIASGALQIAAGAATGAGAVAPSKEKAFDACAASLKGAGAGVEGGTELLAAADDHAAKQAEIASVAASHRAEDTKRRMEDLKEEEQSARDLIRNAFDFLKAAAETKANVDRAALSSRV